MPDSTRPVLIAALEQANRIDERYEGYRALLVHQLASVIQVQDAGGSQSERRGRVEAQVVAAADKVGAQLEGSDSWKLLRARVRNFKLLEDVSVEFSIDPDRPLTVIRAENGSGKTSLLYSLTWAIFGTDGLPVEAKAATHLIRGAARHPVGCPGDDRVRPH